MGGGSATNVTSLWLGAFRVGKRAALESFYRDYFGTVDRAVGAVVRGVDRDTVVHEVFFKLMTKEETRASCSGDNLEAWVRVVARNHAIDFLRRRQREIPSSVVVCESHEPVNPEKEASRRQLFAMFRAQLPENLVQVFDLRFVQQRSQRDAAKLLGVPRTTLAYRERRVRALMNRFAAQVDG